MYGPRDLRIVSDFPEPPMGETSVKIAVAYCGVCGTDFHKFAGKAGSRPVTYPVPLGHEVSGIVVEVGSAVSDLVVGDRVTVDPNWSCGNCYFCRNGKRHLCNASRGVVKGMAQFVCPPRENVYRIPDGLSLRDASLSEPLSCCLHGMDLLGVQPGETVAVIGFGAIGNLMLQLSLKAGAARVIVVEPESEKRAEIRRAGIECVDRVIECVGIPATVELSLELAGKGATVVLFGVSAPEVEVSIRPYLLFQKELVVKTSYINPATMDRAIALLASGALDTESAIGKVIALDALAEEIETRRYSRRGKVVVSVDASLES